MKKTFEIIFNDKAKKIRFLLPLFIALILTIVPVFINSFISSMGSNETVTQEVNSLDDIGDNEIHKQSESKTEAYTNGVNEIESRSNTENLQSVNNDDFLKNFNKQENTVPEEIASITQKEEKETKKVDYYKEVYNSYTPHRSNKYDNYENTTSSYNETPKEELKVYESIEVETQPQEEQPKYRGRQSSGNFIPNNVTQQNTTTTKNVIASIHSRESKIRAGEEVKLVLEEDLIINGETIPKYSFLTGKASGGGGRINIDVTSVYHNKRIIPLQYSVYTLDGIRGLKASNTIDQQISEDVSNEVIDNSSKTVISTPLGGVTFGSLKKKKEEPYIEQVDGQKVLLKWN